MSVRQTEDLVSTSRIPHLAAKVRASLLEGMIEVGHAQALARLERSAQQEAALQIVLSQSRSVPQTDQLIQGLLEPQKQEESAPSVPEEAQARKTETTSLESEFRRALDSEVSLTRNQMGAGRLVIRFESDEDLDRVYERIVGEK